MNDLLRQKLKASGVHLLISVLIALTCFLIVNYFWYPSPLIKATGVQHIYLLMLVVDLILGPLLTFIVFNNAKKNLKIDLIIIAAVSYTHLTLPTNREV